MLLQVVLLLISRYEPDMYISYTSDTYHGYSWTFPVGMRFNMHKTQKAHEISLTDHTLVYPDTRSTKHFIVCNMGKSF